MPGTNEPPKFESLISAVLRLGVAVSSALILLGCLLLFAEGQTGFEPLPSSASELFTYDQFQLGFVHVLEDALALKPFAVINLGVIVLLATPVARVAVSVLLFVSEKRYSFVVITLAVLAILLISTLVIAPSVRV